MKKLMKRFLHKNSLLLNALSKPLMIGIYQDDKLVKSIESEEKASEFVPKNFKDFAKRI